MGWGVICKVAAAAYLGWKQFNVLSSSIWIHISESVRKFDFGLVIFGYYIVRLWDNELVYMKSLCLRATWICVAMTMLKAKSFLKSSLCPISFSLVSHFRNPFVSWTSEGWKHMATMTPGNDVEFSRWSICIPNGIECLSFMFYGIIFSFEQEGECSWNQYFYNIELWPAPGYCYQLLRHGEPYWNTNPISPRKVCDSRSRRQLSGMAFNSWVNHILFPIQF